MAVMLEYHTAWLLFDTAPLKNCQQNLCDNLSPARELLPSWSSRSNNQYCLHKWHPCTKGSNSPRLIPMALDCNKASQLRFFQTPLASCSWLQSHTGAHFVCKLATFSAFCKPFWSIFYSWHPSGSKTHKRSCWPCDCRSHGTVNFKHQGRPLETLTAKSQDKSSVESFPACFMMRRLFFSWASRRQLAASNRALINAMLCRGCVINSTTLVDGT